MIVYSNDVGGFRSETETNSIAYNIEQRLMETLGRGVSPSEKRSWANSLQHMNNAVRRSQVPDDCGVLIEFILPLCSKRIDFIITGKDGGGHENVVIVELKQWEKAAKTQYADLVMTYLGGNVREATHPSCQVASYQSFLSNFLEVFYEGDLRSYACAYLHNYRPEKDDALLDDVYQYWRERAPLFLGQDQEKLANFIREYLQAGAGREALYKIENSRIRPSKKLVDYVASMFRGNQEFVLLDEQKVAFEKAKQIALAGTGKNVIIVYGGPGTGKSVISMNLLNDILRAGLNAAFVAPSGPFREVMEAKLRGQQRGGALTHLFKGSGSFLDYPENAFDCLIVDEAHRLSGPHQWYRGESQAHDVVKAAKSTIFFVDDNQALRLNDIGSSEEIRKRAEAEGAVIHEVELTAQFRCGGAEGYINWLDHIWQIRDTGNYSGWTRQDFEFEIFDDPNELFAAIKKKQREGHAARMLAGYAWPWTKTDENRHGSIKDVEIPEFGFALPWNSVEASRRWAIEEWGDDQVGCIYTSQGLEFDYVGVIIGRDIGFDESSMQWVAHWKDYKDRGGKAGLKDRPEDLVRYLCNIYKVLMSRGMKGCYVYFCRDSARRHFRRMLRSAESGTVQVDYHATS